ncbi:MAG: NTP transferase domain-containing protein [Lachnospiraceae bacterium]|jgi:spore coat polysaccharide biosynthesis protein SpsF|nr:NTP transferase domain-containing protein [Lachnospiraceae bacterium]
MRINAIIQARCGSTRFPDKVFAEIDGKPLLWHVIDRLRYAKMIDDIIVATTTNLRDSVIEDWCQKEEIKCFRGSEDDVLNRYYSASVSFPSDIIVRVTADDPFKEPSVIDLVIKKLCEEGKDFVTNNFPPSYPEGLDCEAFTFKVLETMEKSAHDTFEREHVTQYVYHNPDKFKIGNVVAEQQLSTYRWTIDNQEDYDMVKSIYAARSHESKGLLLMDEILEILKANPEIARINSHVKRSTMYQK